MHLARLLNKRCALLVTPTAHQGAPTSCSHARLTAWQRASSACVAWRTASQRPCQAPRHARRSAAPWRAHIAPAAWRARDTHCTCSRQAPNAVARARDARLHTAEASRAHKRPRPRLRRAVQSQGLRALLGMPQVAPAWPWAVGVPASWGGTSELQGPSCCPTLFTGVQASELAHLLRMRDAATPCRRTRAASWCHRCSSAACKASRHTHTHTHTHEPQGPGYDPASATRNFVRLVARHYLGAPVHIRTMRTARRQRHVSPLPAHP